MDNLPPDNEFSELIGRLMADDNFGKIVEAVKGSFSTNAENDQPIDSAPVEAESSAPAASKEASVPPAIPSLTPELISKLPAIMSMLSGNTPEGGRSHSRMDERKKLLYALKPFLSERRRDAIDSIVNIAGITDLFGI